MAWHTSYPAYRRMDAGSRMERRMTETTPFEHKLRIRDLAAGAAHGFDLTPDAGARAAIAAALGIPAVRKLRLSGRLEPMGRADWRLTARLGATVVQDCVVTLDPVTTRIDEDVARSYLANPPATPEADEIEMPEDDTIEPLPEILDLGAVMIEALALNLPLYPHAEGVAPLNASFTEPGKTPMSDAEARPFAGLAGLRDKLTKDES